MEPPQIITDFGFVFVGMRLKSAAGGRFGVEREQFSLGGAES